VSNVKILNERLYSTDGINPVNSRNVTVKNSFIRCKDDCVSVKGLNDTKRLAINKTPIHDISVSGCVFWSDNNNGVVIGSETFTESIRNVSFTDIDFLKTSNTCGDIAAVMAVICLHDTTIEDVRFENIRVEHATGPLFSIICPDVLFGNIWGWHNGEGLSIRNIMYKNIKIQCGPHSRSYLHGRDADRVISGVTFDNVEINGKKMRSLTDGRVEANEFTESIMIT
jgi:polygalacturonase